MREIQFALMRFARLVAMVLAECGTLLAVLTGVTGFAVLVDGLGRVGEPLGINPAPYDGSFGVFPAWLVEHPLGMLALGIAGVAFCFCRILSTGMPFRYTTTMPGLPVKNCDNCTTEVKDLWFCTTCKEFRWAKTLSATGYALSFVVTGLFIAHDVFTLFFIYGGRKS